LFKQDQSLSDYYNKELAGGKWDHLMDQAHLGQFDWEPPRINAMPAVSEILPLDSDNYGVAIDGDVNAWPGHYLPPELPPFDSFNPGRSYIEVFAEGTRPINFTIEADQPWIVITEDQSQRLDRRFWVEIDWKKAPVGTNTGVIAVKGKRKPVNVKVTAVKAGVAQAREARGRFASLTGPISIASHQVTAAVAANGAQWLPLPGYGRGQAAMSVFPVTTQAVLPPQAAPRLDYDVYVPRAGDYQVTLVLGPVMDFVPDRGMRLAVSFDDRAPQVLDIFSDRSAQTFLGEYWQMQFTRDNVRYLRSTHKLSAAGAHRLKISMVDPGIVLEKIEISDRALPPTYFGPQELSVFDR
jgi:hypothetical protein